jgi:hypothetical protein
MILFTQPVVSTKRLFWHAATSTFVGEISEIGNFGRVYDDACDVGLTLVSQYEDRNPLVMVVNHTERDAEGDIAYWDLVSADFTKVGFTVRIYND